MGTNYIHDITSHRVLESAICSVEIVNIVKAFGLLVKERSVETVGHLDYGAPLLVPGLVTTASQCEI